MSYPVAFQMDFVEQRSRLATFFRIILVIPLMIVAIFYALAAYVAVIIAWFALLFTARWPQALHNFTASYLRWSTQVLAYFYLLTDAYPPFGLAENPSYPLHITFDPPLPHYSRVRILFRVFYMLPLYIVIELMSYGLGAIAGLSWLVIVVLGRQPAALQNVVVFFVAYNMKLTALLLLLTQDYPPFEA